MASTSVLPPATAKQPSRKGKKAWRKNVDITEVTKGLDDVRDEIISGGIVSEKPSEQLFIVDTAGDAEIEKKQRSKKLLRADEILAVRSAVPGIDGRKRKAAEVADASSKRQKDNKWVSQKDLKRLRMVADSREVLAVDTTGAEHDPWAVALPSKHDSLDFVKKPQPVREPDTLRRAPKPLTVNGKAMPAVPRPQGGKSYNPLVDDWTAVLEKEGEAAVKAEKERIAARQAEEDRKARIEAEIAKVEAAERDELASEYESDWDGFMSEGEKPVYTMKMLKTKSPAERTKIRLRKERENREAQARQMKQRHAQLNNLKQITKDIAARDARRKVVAREEESSDDEEYEVKRQRFNRPPIPTAPLEVVLPDELQDSLRRLKPEGNLLTDRYRNHIVNGKLEARRRAGTRKKAKVTETEKWTYKDWTLK